MNHLLANFDEKHGTNIVGVDEAGRGPLAGPVVAAAVQIRDYVIEFELINDSKKLSEKKRLYLYNIIMKNCHTGIGIVYEKKIDEINILNATFLAMRIAIDNLTKKGAKFNLVLVDGNHKIREYAENQECIIKGDSKSLSIAAASIIAKVTRDNIMLEYDKIYKNYGFARHKGYGTKAHFKAILKHGKTECHRDSFLTKLVILK